MTKSRKEVRRAAHNRILLCSTLFYPNIGGVENSLYHLSRAYRKNGFFPWILTSTGGDPHATRSARDVRRIRGVPVIRYKFSHIALLRLFRVARALRGLNSKGGWRAVIARDHYSALAATFLRIPCAYLVPGLVEQQHRPATRNPLKWANHLASMLMQRWALRCVPEIVVFSENMARAVTEVTGGRIVATVRPGLESDRFRPLAFHEKDARRKSLGISGNRKIAVAVGRMARQKRFDLAIEAVKNLPPEWQLMFVGDGPYRSRLERQVAESRLGDRVTFAGKVPDPEVFLQIADVFLLSSDHEPLGQVLIEAMGCGLPIAALDPSLPGVFTATGEIVPDRWLRTADQPRGPALSNAIEAAYEIGHDRDEISAWATTQFSWEVLAERLRVLGSR